jgi:hypothetical protein
LGEEVAAAAAVLVVAIEKKEKKGSYGFGVVVVLQEEFQSFASAGAVLHRGSFGGGWRWHIRGVCVC